MAANPIEKDALFGPISIEILARVAARTGRPGSRYRRFAETLVDTAYWGARFRHAAHARASSARSNVRWASK